MITGLCNGWLSVDWDCNAPRPQFFKPRWERGKESSVCSESFNALLIRTAASPTSTGWEHRTISSCWFLFQDNNLPLHSVRTSAWVYKQPGIRRRRKSALQLEHKLLRWLRKTTCCPLLVCLNFFYTMIWLPHERNVKSHQIPENKCDANARFCNSDPSSNPDTHIFISRRI